jgi:hypothetical protein
MSAASWALQQAMFAALSADANVKSVLGDPARLFDAVPRDTAFPYSVIGDAQEADCSTATDSGSEHVVRLDVWSRAGGHKECKAAADAVRGVLDGAALTLSGHTLIDMRFIDADYARETDGETYRATLRFRAVTEPQ